MTRTKPVLIAASVAASVAAVVVLVVSLWPRPPGPAVIHSGTSHYVVAATVESPRVGASDIEFDITDRTGGPAHLAAVNVQAVMPQMGHADPPVGAAPTGGGHYRAYAVPLMMTGPMELLVALDYPGGVDHLTLPIAVSG